MSDNEGETPKSKGDIKREIVIPHDLPPPPYSARNEYVVEVEPCLPPVVASLGSQPQGMQCPQCHQQILTKLSYHSGDATWLYCFFMYLAGCQLCCCLPFCVDSCQDADHHCPHCDALIGKYKQGPKGAKTVVFILSIIITIFVILYLVTKTDRRGYY